MCYQKYKVELWAIIIIAAIAMHAILMTYYWDYGRHQRAEIAIDNKQDRRRSEQLIIKETRDGIIDEDNRIKSDSLNKLLKINGTKR